MDAPFDPECRPHRLLLLGPLDPGVLRTDLEDRPGDDRGRGQDDGMTEVMTNKLKSVAMLIVPLLFLCGGAPESEAQSMTPILARDTPAHLAARRFMRGVNLSNYLEYNPGDPARNQTYSANDFVLIRAEGFDHVRVPVAW